MMLMDVNVLVYAHREDVGDHAAYRSWLETVINSDTAFAYSELVLSGFIRVVTHPKVLSSRRIWKRLSLLQSKSVRRAKRFA